MEGAEEGEMEDIIEEWVEHFFEENEFDQKPEEIDLSGPSASESDDW